uniref:LIM domain only 1 n=1 Tax=Podarcis muralis TaxID=64176 RepID=A0A670I6X8_PODMU
MCKRGVGWAAGGKRRKEKARVWGGVGGRGGKKKKKKGGRRAGRIPPPGRPALQTLLSLPRVLLFCRRRLPFFQRSGGTANRRLGGRAGHGDGAAEAADPRHNGAGQGGRLFGTTGNCAACSKLIPAFEMVMRARDNVYHLDCFACQLCNQRFCVGDKFFLKNNMILCQMDYEEGQLNGSFEPQVQ